MTQVEFIALLFEQLGYDTVSQRKGWMQRNFGVHHADELDSRQRSMAIEALRDEKAAKR